MASWRIALLAGLLAIVQGRPSFQPLSYYETLDYDPSVLSEQHERVTRSADDQLAASGKGGAKVTLHLEAFNRTFVSSLSRHRGVFGPSVKFLVGGVETSEYDPRTLYQGRLQDEPNSRVIGHIIDGVFDGTIRSPQGTYHVERAHKFFPAPQPFHSIIYHEADVQFPNTPSTCGVKGQLMEELRRKASHAVPLTDRVLYGEDRERVRRQTINGNRFCPIRVAGDHLFLANIGGGSVVNAMSEIASLISDVQEIYRDTDFDGDGQPDEVQPVVVELEILEQGSPGYRYGAPSIEVNEFLDLWSQEDQSAFCLALLLTHRDFANGVLGLAWVAQPPGGNRGGICEDPVQIQVGTRSLNTAIVTFLNFGQTQPRSVSEITIAHEFGHNFGSPHDPSGSCSPGGGQGNFIMFPQATDGALPNNRRFSRCSINSINSVLTTKSQCFTVSEAFCGNGIREEGEPCDCGSMCDLDPCCNDDCTLTEDSQCSSMEPCCNENCRLLSSDIVCLNQTECGEPSVCPGNDAGCPDPQPREGRVVCNDGQNVCVDGVCSGSVCILNRDQDCQCTVENGNMETDLCHVCCERDGQCQSSFMLYGTEEGRFRESGRSCNDFRGYCSNSNPPSCVVVDNEQTLDDLLDIFNLNTLNTIAAWLQRYWYVPVAVVIVIAIIIVLLHVTYRKRRPLKKSISRVNSTLRRQNRPQPPSSSRAQPSRSAEGERARRREISQGEGERRLRQFFPTADRETIVAVMRNTRSESKSVKRLIELGYPLRKVPLPRS